MEGGWVGGWGRESYIAPLQVRVRRTYKITNVSTTNAITVTTHGSSEYPFNIFCSNHGFFSCSLSLILLPSSFLHFYDQVFARYHQSFCYQVFSYYKVLSPCYQQVGYVFPCYYHHLNCCYHYWPCYLRDFHRCNQRAISMTNALYSQLLLACGM